MPAGRDLTYLDVENSSNVCVLGAGHRRGYLFDFTDPVDQYHHHQRTALPGGGRHSYEADRSGVPLARRTTSGQQ
ncbi:MAG: hypothetical protein ACLR0P_14215 [Oscillospiraceae bacterium]